MIIPLLIIGIVLVGLGVAGIIYYKTIAPDCPFLIPSGTFSSNNVAQLCTLSQYAPIVGGVLIMLGISISIGASVEKK